MFKNLLMQSFLRLRFRNSQRDWTFALFGLPNSFVSNSVYRDFYQASQLYSANTSISFNFIDCTNETMCGNMEIRVPTLVLFNKNTNEKYFYEGPMLMESFLDFINKITNFNSLNDIRLKIRNKNQYNVKALINDGFCVVTAHYNVTPQKYIRDAINLMKNYSSNIIIFGEPSFIDNFKETSDYIVVQKYGKLVEYKSLIPSKLADEVLTQCLL